MKSYTEIRDEEPVMFECFFSFSNEQSAEGIKKHGIKGKKIHNGGMGLYGTREGIDQFLGFYDKQKERIEKECDPQEVYDYEFWNHECGYTNDDREAIEIVVNYFGVEKAGAVKRKFAYTSI